MDVENPNEFLEEKKSKKATPETADAKSVNVGAGRDRDAENTRSANPSVRKAGGSGRVSIVKRDRS